MKTTTTTLFMQNDKSDKTYIAEIVGKTVTLMYGKRNGTLTGYEYKADTTAEAETLYTSKVAEKIAEGYSTKQPKNVDAAKSKSKKTPAAKSGVVNIKHFTDLRDKARKLAATGMTVSAIAKQLGTPQSSTYRWIVYAAVAAKKAVAGKKAKVA